jgi:hypothetical protein
MFEAVCRLLDWRTDALTKTERVRIGRVAKELREAGATVDKLLWGEKVTGPMFALMRERGNVPKAENVLDAWSEIDRRWQRSLKARTREAAEPIHSPGLPPLPLTENRRRWRAMVERFGSPTPKSP